MKHTIRFLIVSLCMLFAFDAGARTLYVDARRPNNNGNGRSLRKAKRTIQAAVNIAKKGDTIIVYPGNYSQVWTNNKKIKIKSKSGASKTDIGPGQRRDDLVLGKSGSGTGKKTKLVGFSLISLGTSGARSVLGGTLTSCTLRGCDGRNASFSRCRISSSPAVFDYDSLGIHWVEGGDGSSELSESQFSNCLFTDLSLNITYSTLVNCTIADNSDVQLVFVRAYNTIFHRVPASQFKKSKHNKLKNCYKGANPGFVRPDTTKRTKIIYHLKKGSPCINKGTKTKAAKKLYGTKDLGGKKRVRGKSVDIGCYEY